jgi:hypothetical protein
MFKIPVKTQPALTNAQAIVSPITVAFAAHTAVRMAQVKFISAKIKDKIAIALLSFLNNL